MSLLKRISHKLKHEGLFELICAVFRLLILQSIKTIFKLKAALFFIKQKKEKFIRRPLGELDLSDYPAEQVYEKIKNNEYVILSENFKNWGRGSWPAELHWNADLNHDVVWPQNNWGVDIPIRVNHGDIKASWELGRLHQLVQLGLCYQSAPSKDLQIKIESLAGLILQDFNQMNQKFNGTQWMCAMDVGIRLANICLAVDLLSENFYKNHQDLLRFEVHRHEFFIKNNLENKAGHVVNNHYLGNLIGLTFCAFHIDSSDRQQKIERLDQELRTELKNQFLEDGGNFENSTYYHRLSTELILFGLCLTQQQATKNPLNPSEFEFLEKILQFSCSLSDYEGQVPQVGDNDSGHLFIVNPFEFLKNDLQHQNLIGALDEFIQKKQGENLLTDVFKKFIQANSALKYLKKVSDQSGFFGKKADFLQALDQLKTHSVQKYRFEIPAFDLSQIKFEIFPAFGLFLMKNDQFFLSIRSGQSPRDFIAGHRHFDQLAFYLKTPTMSTARDPGSYVYTADKVLRNLFRGAGAHHVPYSVKDASLEHLDIFKMSDYAGHCIYFGAEGFLGYYQGALGRYYRLMTFANGLIEVFDWNENHEPLVQLDFKQTVFSPRYGVIIHD